MHNEPSRLATNISFATNSSPESQKTLHSGSSNGTSSTTGYNPNTPDIELARFRDADEEVGELDRLMSTPYEDDPHLGTGGRRGTPSSSEKAHLHSSRNRKSYIPRRSTLSLIIVIILLGALNAYQHGEYKSKISSISSSSPHASTPATKSRWQDTCLCPRTPTGDRLCQTYPPSSLKSARVHTGTNARLKTVLSRFVRERAVDPSRKLKVGIMGGSVSACHAVASEGESLAEGCYGRIVGDWLSSRFGGPDSVEVDNAAIGGMDSSYYAFCGSNHLHKDSDIVILEFDVNDQPSLDYLIYFDQLLRIVLNYPKSPAVIILGAWGPHISHDVGSLTPMTPHLPVAIYYDTPYLTLQNFVYNTFLRFPQSVSKAFWIHDRVHPNRAGHTLLADLVISHVESVLCEIEVDVGPDQDLGMWSPVEDGGNWSVETSKSFTDLQSSKTFSPISASDGPINATAYHFLSLPHATSMPPISYSLPLSLVLDATKPDLVDWAHFMSQHVLQPPVPFCVDANDKKNPLRPSENQGWRTMVWKAEKHFWASETPGAKIRVDIKVNEGRVAVFYFRSETLSPGVAYCWVDDNRKGAKKLEGYWALKTNVPAVAYIDSEVTAGDHYVNCEISSESHDPESPIAHHFRIVAVMAT